MGLLGIFKKKKSSKKDNIACNTNSISACKAIIKENCELFIDSSRQITEAKVEYKAVTSYLTDMQKIDMIPMEQKEIIEEAATNIINLNKERLKYQNNTSLINDMQYKILERYELQLPKDLTIIKDNELYRDMIEKDIKHLDQEKMNLLQEENEIGGKQSFLKGITIGTCVVMLILFGIFAALVNLTKVNLMIPFLLTVFMGMVSVIYIYMEVRKNIHDLRLIQIKKKKQVLLMNKVKIKAVNNLNYLEYVYSKYMVDNYNQLKKLWNEYIKLKDEAQKYKSNTELLNFYNRQLIIELKRFGIADSEIWIYQPSAILDSREMVEVRHRLNVRRHKLRERIDIHNKHKIEAIKEIREVIKAYPECSDEADIMIRKYNIEKEMA